MKLNFGIRMLTSLTIFIVLCSAFVMTSATNEEIEYQGYGIDVTFAGSEHAAYSSDSIANMRNWKIFVLTSDTARNNVLLYEAEQYLGEIKLAYDTINGVQFVLDSAATYGCFIRALDICMRQRPAWAVPDGNKVMGYYSNANPDYWRYYAFHFAKKRNSLRPCIHL